MRKAKAGKKYAARIKILTWLLKTGFKSQQAFLLTSQLLGFWTSLPLGFSSSRLLDFSSSRLLVLSTSRLLVPLTSRPPDLSTSRPLDLSTSQPFYSFPIAFNSRSASSAVIFPASSISRIFIRLWSIELSFSFFLCSPPR